MDLDLLYGVISILGILIGVAVVSIITPRILHEGSVLFNAFIALALGVMLGVASLHLLPEVFEAGETGSVAFLLSIFAFIVLYWFSHGHSHEHGEHSHTTTHVHSRPLFLGQFLHAITDGVAIALAFHLSSISGLVVALAIALHHIPMMSGIAERYRGHVSSHKLLWLTLGASSGMLVGVLGVEYLGELILPVYFYAVAAASFLFVALSDFVVHLSTERTRYAKLVFTLFALVGLGVGYVAEELMHASEGGEHHHGHDEEESH
jgi:zinc and cadmium transporter